MTVQAKTSLKWLVGCITGTITILVFTFSLGMGFAKNTADHDAIKVELGSVKKADDEETYRSKAADAKTAAHISSIQQDISVIQTTIASVEKTTERIEKKLP